MSKRLKWADHVWRSSGLLKKALVEKLNGKRPRGHPRQRWTDKIKNYLIKCSQKITKEDSMDRERQMEECSRGNESPSRTIKL